MSKKKFQSKYSVTYNKIEFKISSQLFNAKKGLESKQSSTTHVSEYQMRK